MSYYIGTLPPFLCDTFHSGQRGGGSNIVVGWKSSLLGRGEIGRRRGEGKKERKRERERQNNVGSKCADLRKCRHRSRQLSLSLPPLSLIAFCQKRKQRDAEIKSGATAEDIRVAFVSFCISRTYIRNIMNSNSFFYFPQRVRLRLG